ncbi:TetR/AcrR family transcriptional regulator [Mycolicibacterium moriokaense]|nr:TetR/AcrR family transcriptional regulator [Mycolicibacterium moriokaense]
MLRNSTPCKVIAVTTASSTPVARGRRGVRPSGDDRELAILETAKRLFENRSIAEVSVDDLARGAGLSRPTFYFYFASKDAVLVALFKRAIHEADIAFGEHTQTPPPADRYEMCRSGISVFFDTFARHRGVTRAAHEVRASHPEVRELLVKFMDKWIDATTAMIESWRAQGLAPTTLPARDLATALYLMNERALFASFADEQPSIAREKLLDTLTHIWVTSIYGEAR